MDEKTSLGDVILDSIELRRDYEENKIKYERLISVVVLILNAALERKKIKLHSMSYRVKDYSSFLEKVERKRYKDPFKQCTDLAGSRIICLFLSQIDEIKKIVEEEFDVIEVTDKRSVKKYDQFGYLSLHMLVKIPKSRIKLTECEGLADLICELQIRTILQEAWAEIEHYLNYKTTKQEKHDELLRKIFSLAGMFEVADSTFEEINTGFSHMIKKKLQEENSDEITALGLFKFSKMHFKWYTKEWDKLEERSFLNLSNEMKKINIRSLIEIKRIMDKYKNEIVRYEAYHKKKDKNIEHYFSPVGLIRAALALEYGIKFDMAFGLRGYSERVKKEISF
ncbi:MAG: hypothetical protein V1859_07225 [archaeon]